jgi:hypothetical protein
MAEPEDSFELSTLKQPAVRPVIAFRKSSSVSIQTLEDSLSEFDDEDGDFFRPEIIEAVPIQRPHPPRKFKLERAATIGGKSKLQSLRAPDFHDPMMRLSAVAFVRATSERDIPETGGSPSGSTFSKAPSMYVFGAFLD